MKAYRSGRKNRLVLPKGLRLVRMQTVCGVIAVVYIGETEFGTVQCFKDGEFFKFRAFSKAYRSYATFYGLDAALFYAAAPKDYRK